MPIVDIKPLESDKYKLVVVDTKKGYYRLTRLLDDEQSPIYRRNHLIVYGCFKDCHDDGDKYFNNLCDSEASTWVQ